MISKQTYRYKPFCGIKISRIKREKPDEYQCTGCLGASLAHINTRMRTQSDPDEDTAGPTYILFGVSGRHRYRSYFGICKYGVYMS